MAPLDPHWLRLCVQPMSRELKSGLGAEVLRPTERARFSSKYYGF